MRKMLIILCLFWFAALAAGCSGGGGPAGVAPPGPEPTPEPSPTPPPPPTPPPGPPLAPEPSEPAASAPTVTSTDPLRDAVGVETNAQIRIVFDRDIAAASVTQESTVVNCAGTRIAGEAFANPDNRSVGFRPGERLPLLSRCDVTVADITDADARPMAAPYEFGFDTRSGGWGAAARVNNEVVEFDIASENNGDVVAVWKTIISNEIKLARYVALTGAWEDAVVIGTVPNLGSYIFNPQVVTDGMGSAIASWASRRPDGGDEILVMRYNFVRREVLSQATAVSQMLPVNTPCTSFNQKMAMDGTGNVFVAWSQCLADGGSEIRIVRFDNSVGAWRTPYRASAERGRSVAPDIGVDSAGNAVVVWVQYDAPMLHVSSRRYNASNSSWENLQRLSGERDGNLTSLQIAVSETGDAVAVWNQFDGTRFSVFARRYTSAPNAWAPIEILSDDREGAFGPSIAIDPSGNSVLAWQQYVDNRPHIYARRYIASEGAWSGFEDVATQGEDLPKIAMDSAGGGFVVWGKEDLRVDCELSVASYSAQNPQWVGNGVKGEISFNPFIVRGLEEPRYQIVMSGNGIVTLVWENFNMPPSRNELWMRRFE